MKIREAIEAITSRFQIPLTVIAEYAGISRRTVRRYLNEETNSQETEARLLAGLRLIVAEMNALCSEGEETDEEWED